MASQPRKGVLVRVEMITAGNYGLSMKSGYGGTVSEAKARMADVVVRPTVNEAAVDGQGLWSDRPS